MWYQGAMKEGFRIRPEIPADFGDINGLLREAFGGEAEVRLVRAIRESADYIPDLALVAESGGKPAGYLMMSGISIGHAGGSLPALSLAPVAVSPPVQGEGVGSGLVRRGLEEAGRQGWSVVLVIGHPGYYPRFGFVPARPRGLEAPFPVPDEAFMVLAPEGALPPPPARVVFPPVFSAAL